MEINRRKTAWPIRLPKFMSEAVKVSGAWLETKDGKESEFAQSNPRIRNFYGGDFAYFVELRAVHHGRELIAKLSIDEAEELGIELMKRAQRARDFERAANDKQQKQDQEVAAR